MKNDNESTQKDDNMDQQKWSDLLMERIKNLPESSLEKNTKSTLARDAYHNDRFWGTGKNRILLEGGTPPSSPKKFNGSS